MMSRCNKVALALFLGLIGIQPTGWAAPVETSDGWVRATRPGQEVAAAYLTLKSPVAQTLTHVESPVAGAVEIHEMRMDHDVMKMRMMEKLPLPAGRAVILSPGGFHLMLFDLKAPLKAGEKATFTLSIRDPAGNVSRQNVQLPIRAD